MSPPSFLGDVPQRSDQPRGCGVLLATGADFRLATDTFRGGLRRVAAGRFVFEKGSAVGATCRPVTPWVGNMGNKMATSHDVYRERAFAALATMRAALESADLTPDTRTSLWHLAICSHRRHPATRTRHQTRRTHADRALAVEPSRTSTLSRVPRSPTRLDPMPRTAMAATTASHRRWCTFSSAKGADSASSSWANLLTMGCRSGSVPNRGGSVGSAFIGGRLRIHRRLILPCRRRFERHTWKAFAVRQ